jgi:hypothetical protein
MDLLEFKHSNRMEGKKDPGRRRQTADRADSGNDPLADLRAVKRQHGV